MLRPGIKGNFDFPAQGKEIRKKRKVFPLELAATIQISARHGVFYSPLMREGIGGKIPER